jgi:hypothetical protein
MLNSIRKSCHRGYILFLAVFSLGAAFTFLTVTVFAKQEEQAKKPVVESVTVQTSEGLRSTHGPEGMKWPDMAVTKCSLGLLLVAFGKE